ncbi:MAG: 3-hydroxyacyl-CoA dehydrogenase [Alphaproteobacteria bacterium]|nr:3-hydroxyacyl-CoA dehydrogenase [Alphaproteobacteria bacterium]
MDVNGLAAVITGGGSGIGAEVARHCAKAGMRVALLDVNMNGANAVAEEIGGIAIECDVTSAESGEAAITAACAANGIGRLLVNCAGIGTPGRIVGRNGPLPLDAFNAVIQVNLVGSFNMMRLFAAELGEADSFEDGERGLIVSTASVAATEGQIGQAAYASSKGGIVSLNLVAAREFASRGIRVNTIAPGLIDTPMMAGLPDEARASLAEQPEFPKRLGYPAEYAQLVIHMCENVLINGAVFRLDGALRMAAR